MSQKKTLTLKKDASLDAEIVIDRDKSLTINMNGCELSDGRLSIVSNQIFKITGSGAFRNCQIAGSGEGTTVLAGDVTYEYAGDDPVRTHGGTLKVKKGTVKGGIRCCGNMRMTGGRVEGGALLLNDEYSPRQTFVFSGGTIDGDVRSDTVHVTISGGTVNGDVRISEDPDYSATKVLIEGGAVNGQVVLSSVRPTFTMTGGTIRSEKSPVIDAGLERALSTAEKKQGLGRIDISGGEIISAGADGIGVRVYSANVRLSGGAVQNTANVGVYGIYSCTYTRKSSCQADLSKCAVTGFQKPVEHLLKKDHCGKDVSYRYDKNTATLTVSGTGTMFDGTILTDSIIGRVEHVVISDGVTAVGARNFCWCEKLKDVRLPDSLTAIGTSAFGECTSLEAANFPSGLKTIGSEAFFHDRSLKEAVMPDSVESIGTQCFWECTGLEKLVLSKSLTQIPDYAFEHCDSLTKVDIPGSVTQIGRGAFLKCINLSEVTMGDHVTLGKGAFSGTPYAKNK